MTDLVLDSPDVSSIIINEHTPIFKERPKGINSRILEWDHASFERAQQLIASTEKRLRMLYPGQLVDLALDTYFGPYRLNENFACGKGIEDSKENLAQKMLSARIQHGLVHTIERASLQGPHEKFTAQMYKIVQNFENITQILKYGGPEHGVSMIWYAIKSELAIARALLDAGLDDVILPEYSIDISNVQPGSNELLDWDVKEAIDLVAVKRGKKCLLIDCKGRRFYEGNDPYGRKGERREIDVLKNQRPINTSLLPLGVQKIIKKFDVPDVERLRVIVPTTGKLLGDFAWDKINVQEQRRELQRFGRLDPLVASAIFKTEEDSNPLRKLVRIGFIESQKR